MQSIQTRNGISAQKYGLTNQKTVEFSQKLDLVVNEFMMIKYSAVNKQE
ncbi:aspartyl-phosphate phosphatase Spo0E family protein [Bacillus cereus]